MLYDKFESVHLAFVKRFEFPEPVFCPEKLRRGKIFSKRDDFRFFCNPRAMNKKINSMEKTELPVGILKPIKNLSIPKDNFWRPFKYNELGPQLTQRRELPYYPFQVIPNQQKVGIDKEYIKKVTGMDIVDAKVDAQIRLFPPGVGTAHFYLYVKPRELHTDQLLQLTSDPRSIRVSFQGKEKNIFEFFNSFINMTVNHISERKQPRDIPGYFLLFNFQGKGPSSLSEDVLKDLSRILQNLPPSRKGEIGISEEDNRAGRKTDADLIFITPRTAILFVDEGIRSLGHVRLLKGRRCFRTHFLSTVEMAYTSEWLLRYYNEHLKKILLELKNVPIGKGALDKVRQIMVANIFDPCMYSTLIRSILPIRENLSKTSMFYAQVFDHAATAMGISSRTAELVSTTEQLYEKASEWNMQEEFFKKIYKELEPIVIGHIGKGVEVVLDKALEMLKEKLSDKQEDELSE